MAKGVTPVIAIVLLLMMTVAAAAGAYIWMSGMLTDMQTGVGEQIGGIVETQQQSINIVTVECTASTDTDAKGYIAANIRNTGAIDIDSGTWAIVATDTDTELEKLGIIIKDTNADTNTLNYDSSLATGEIEEGEFTVSKGLDPGKEYSVIVETPAGIPSSAKPCCAPICTWDYLAAGCPAGKICCQNVDETCSNPGDCDAECECPTGTILDTAAIPPACV